LLLSVSALWLVLSAVPFRAGLLLGVSMRVAMVSTCRGALLGGAAPPRFIPAKCRLMRLFFAFCWPRLPLLQAVRRGVFSPRWQMISTLLLLARLLRRFLLLRLFC
jgi:hypothetical protein